MGRSRDTANLLSDGGIGAAELLTDAVETAKIKDLNVTTGKMADAAVTLAKLAQPLTKGTAVATTSGTEKDFTGIPSWARRVTVVLANVSLSGSALLRVRLGTSGGFVTSGYLSTSSVISAGAATAAATAGFDVYTNAPNAAYLYSGSITFHYIDASNTWVCSGVIGAHGVTWTITLGGYIALGGALTQVRLTTSNGTDTFDSGTVNVFYE